MGVYTILSKIDNAMWNASLVPTLITIKRKERAYYRKEAKKLKKHEKEILEYAEKYGVSKNASDEALDLMDKLNPGADPVKILVLIRAQSSFRRLVAYAVYSIEHTDDEVFFLLKEEQEIVCAIGKYLGIHNSFIDGMEDSTVDLYEFEYKKYNHNIQYRACFPDLERIKSNKQFIKLLDEYQSNTELDASQQLPTNGHNSSEISNGDAIRAGKKGEQDVQYALKWLKYGEPLVLVNEGKAISITNDVCFDESQEIDHIVIGTQGVFAIETKNYGGIISVDTLGNWYQKKEGKEVGIANPIQQMERHEKMLKSFLPEDVPVISILCVANTRTIIKGIENTKINVVKSDMLAHFIENYPATRRLSDQEVAQCKELIEQHSNIVEQ